jgi:hypothetical protein
MTSSVIEFFSLSGAERTVRAYGARQYARVHACSAAAERRLLAGRRVVQAVPAAVLLREAVANYLVAGEIARNADADESAFSPEQLASALPGMAFDPARPPADPTDDALVRSALRATERLYFDHLSLEHAERTRWALDRAAQMLRGKTEARSISNIRGTRWGRMAAIAIVLSYAAVQGVQAALVPPNIALHKPVTPSSVAYVPAEGQELVDGDTGTSFAVHTQVEESPHVVIDLLDTYRIRRIKVHNRVDGWFDDSLPLVVELSLDGRTYSELARRESHFDGNPPWVIDANGEAGRFVRLRVARRSYLALSEVEVFGRRSR